MSPVLPTKYRTRSQETKRFNHEECGDTRRRLYVTRIEDKGWVFYCHNCAGDAINGFKGFQRADNLSPSETKDAAMHVLKTLNKSDDNHTFIQSGMPLQLPKDFSNAMPREAWAWLTKAGILEHEVMEYNIGYSQRFRRVVLPVYSNTHPRELVYLQYRKVHEGPGPKYLNLRSSKKDIFFHSSQPRFTQGTLFEDEIVFVEDILSAIKLGRRRKTIALLGCYVPAAIVHLLRNINFFWLDPDKRIESLRFARMCSTLKGKGLFLPIFSAKDPKDHTMPEINDHLAPPGVAFMRDYDRTPCTQIINRT